MTCLHPSIRTFSILSILQMTETEAEIVPKLANYRARTGTREARKQLVPFTIIRSANLINCKGRGENNLEDVNQWGQGSAGSGYGTLGQRSLTCHRRIDGSLLKIV